MFNDVSGSGSGSQYGVYNSITNTSNGLHQGLVNAITGSGSGTHRGIDNFISGSGMGAQYGISNSVSNSGDGYHYGSWNSLSGAGSGTKYAVYAWVGDQTGGVKYAGYFTGDVTITGVIANPSDEKLKLEISRTAPNTSLSKLLSINIYEYLYNKEAFPFMSLPRGKQTGMLAQELQKIFPELVTQNIQPAHVQDENNPAPATPETHYLGVNYLGLIPHLVKGIQEQEVLIQAQAEQIKVLQTQVEGLLNGVLTTK
jgi:hypothetical protein